MKKLTTALAQYIEQLEKNTQEVLTNCEQARQQNLATESLDAEYCALLLAIKTAKAYLPIEETQITEAYLDSTLQFANEAEIVRPLTASDYFAQKYTIEQPEQK